VVKVQTLFLVLVGETFSTVLLGETAMESAERKGFSKVPNERPGYFFFRKFFKSFKSPPPPFYSYFYF